jgi:hypothetical protein
MGGLLMYACQLLGSWRAKRAAKSEQRMLERAIRDNGISWLVELDRVPATRTLRLDAIGEALRAQFSAVYHEPTPVRFFDLLQDIDLASAY